MEDRISKKTREYCKLQAVTDPKNNFFGGGGGGGGVTA